MKKKSPLYGGYEIGKTYFIAYWRTNCTVTALHGKGDWMDWSVTVKWEDGHSTTHSTTRDKRDKEIVFA
jgi:galactose mutarotase-like enzyme